MATETTVEVLREFVDWQPGGLRVDRQEGLIRGVKILGLRSRNGRQYLPQALQEAVGLYEGAKVNINHPPTPAPAPRDYRDRLGMIRHVVFRPEEGLFADLRFNPKHPLAEQLAWDAEHCPENVGLSHHVEARLGRREGQTVVEAILRVHSVDVVADPATTQGLFEAVEAAPAVGLSADGQTAWGMKADAPAATGQIISTSATALPSPDPQAERIAMLEAELARLRNLEAEANRRLLIQKLLAEHRLPGPDSTDPLGRLIASPEFIQSLLTAPDEVAVRVLVEDRARLVRAVLQEAASGRLPSPWPALPGSRWPVQLPLSSRPIADRPMARDQLSLAGTVRNVQEFVRAITYTECPLPSVGEGSGEGEDGFPLRRK